MEMSLLKKLPHEVLLHVFKYYLDLQDLLKLTRVSKNISRIALDTMKKQWGVVLSLPTNSNNLFKSQANRAMILLNEVSHTLIQRIKIYDPYAFPPFLTIPNQQEEEDDTAGYSPMVPNSTFLRGALQLDRQQDPLFPPTIEPDLDEALNDVGFMMERFNYHSKRLASLLHVENQLHRRILRGISDYMLGYYKIPEYPLRSIVDIVFYHAIFVTSKDRMTSCEKLGTHHGFSRTFAAATSRLLCNIQSNFCTSTNSDMIGVALWDNINTCLAFTEYRLLAVMKQQPETVVSHYFAELRKSTAGQPLLYLLYTITALFDVIGACYVACHLKDEYAIPVIRKLCAILDRAKLETIKQSMLKDLVDVWLSIDHVYMTSRSTTLFRSMIQDEMTNHKLVI